MADFADDAADKEEMFRSYALQAARASVSHRELQAVGVCHYCASPVGVGLRFCDVDCSKEHADIREIRRKQGFLR